MGKTKKKIVIGDDMFWGDAMKDSLEYEGYEVVIEPRVTGERILELAKDMDMAIVDIQISHKGSFVKAAGGDLIYPGIVFCQELKRRDPSFPVICMAITENDSIDRRLIDAGCIVIYKANVNKEDVLAIIREALV